MNQSSLAAAESNGRDHVSPDHTSEVLDHALLILLDEARNSNALASKSAAVCPLEKRRALSCETDELLRKQLCASLVGSRLSDWFLSVVQRKRFSHVSLPSVGVGHHTTDVFFPCCVGWTEHPFV